ncbi:hypothetical protein [Methylosinus sp. Ce-a6]|uniref:hypothetical protein n=1 Tax=Methylosinus sp. Ce-a6 TaxID=2172005 RepID=UPI00135ABA25|nr:hypothetical protein [Methylosinus sp. Ce-a6]
MKRTIISATISIALSTATLAQTAPPSGSAGACGTLYQQAASAASARIAADDKDIAPPQTVKSLTCLDNILKGVGLNVVVNLLDPTNLFNAIEGQLCNAVTNAWKKALGSAQCGITLSGFNLGAFNFGGNLGGGLSCPKLSFGGGGPPMGYIGIGGAGGSGSLYVNGSARAPTGYSLPNAIGLW